MIDNNNRDPIRTAHLDPVFYNSSTGKPFDKCVGCGRNLLDKSMGYMIEKAIKQYKGYTATDTIFEYALCMKCYEEISQDLSEISRKRISEYYEAHVDFEERRHVLTAKPEMQIGEWLETCLIKGTKKEQLAEYQMICQCQGDQMIFYNLPVLIGDSAMNEMIQLLSDKTLGEMGRFKDKFLGVPPEFKDLFDDRKILIL